MLINFTAQSFSVTGRTAHHSFVIDMNPSREFIPFRMNFAAAVGTLVCAMDYVKLYRNNTNHNKYRNGNSNEIPRNNSALTIGMYFTGGQQH